MRFRKIAAIVLLGAVTSATPAFLASSPAATPARRDDPSARTLPLTISTALGTRAFRVEVARTADEQARGLMFRRALAPDGGMIFPFAPPRMAAFWMKNTVIPLDMIFIRADGTVARIAASTTPYSLEPVESGEPVAAVLEIAGGRAAALGIAPGDVVRWRG